MIEKFFPPHEGGLYLTHNGHHGVYQPLESYIRDNDLRDDFVSAEEYQAVLDTDSLWVLQWYPDTPVGFCRKAASSLAVLLAGVTP